MPRQGAAHLGQPLPIHRLPSGSGRKTGPGYKGRKRSPAARPSPASTSIPALPVAHSKSRCWHHPGPPAGHQRSSTNHRCWSHPDADIPGNGRRGRLWRCRPRFRLLSNDQLHPTEAVLFPQLFVKVPTLKSKTDTAPTPSPPSPGVPAADAAVKQPDVAVLLVPAAPPPHLPVADPNLGCSHQLIRFPSPK